MSEERLFTQEELDTMGARTLDLLNAAIESGDLEKAGKLANRMYAEFSAMHDLYRDWLTHTFSEIGRRFGDEALGEVMGETTKGFAERLADRYEGKSLKRKVQILLAGLRGHLQPLRVEEDDEKIAIIPSPCGSGGRQVLDGLYDGPQAFLRVKGPYDWTFDRTDFPVYCTHCCFQNLYPLFPGEEGSGDLVPADKLGETPCISYILKK
ncbi:MAG: hypothetical protein KKB20_24295 [Proteobacteria bacterium]|nr:hypothetical protein [Pseudomonadota bacterium]